MKVALLFLALGLVLAACGDVGSDFRTRTGYTKIGTSSQALTNHLQGANEAGAGFDLPGAEPLGKAPDQNR